MRSIIYTDGACKGNPGKGGWGWVDYSTGGSLKSTIAYTNCGGNINTTNNRMELTAVIECLKDLPLNRNSAAIYSDSMYVLQGLVKGGDGVLVLQNKKVNFTGWMKAWIERNFKKVKNVDLWKELAYQIERYLTRSEIPLIFRHVKGHSNDEGNDMADALANRGIEELE